MNYSDSERIAGVLEMAGYKKVLLEDNADLIVINACSVRQSAINRISGRFKKYKKLRKINLDLKIILTGCVLESDKKKFEKSFDSVVGIGEMKQLLNCHSELVSESIKITGLIVSTPSKLSTTEIGMDCGYKQKILKQVQNDNKQVCNDNANYFQIKPLHQNKLSAYVPIMTGCNNFCSYCIVPYTRGREYSRPIEEILNEVENLVKRGYKEIILLGQNVNSYQSKVHKACPREASGVKSQKCNFPTLLKSINAIPGNFWIRFLTSHPKDMSKELIKTVAECKKVTSYIHLALQSGNNEILKKMNRKYTAEHFLKLVGMIREYLPNAAISTDIIIGLPSETEKRFQNTVEIMKKAKFDMAYLNKYSPRAGTAAAKLDDNISWAEKKRREKILTEILKETALENNKKYVGKIVEILVDKIDNHFIYGKTESFKNVRIVVGSIVPLGLWNQNAKRLHRAKATMEPASSGIKKGEFVKIKITQANAWGLEGEMAISKYH